MANVSTTLTLDTRSFEQKLRAAEFSITRLNRTSKQVNTDLTRFRNAIGGANIARNALMVEKAIGGIGNVAKLTDRQLREAHSHLSEYLQQVQRSGGTATKSIKELAAEVERLHSKASSASSSGGEGGILS